MTFQYYEGTMDYLAATPALIITFAASGSIEPGFVAYTAGTDATVYQPVTASGSAVVPAGFAIQTAATGTEVAVVVWGFLKNVPYLGASCIGGNLLVMSGSGACTYSAGAYPNQLTVGKVVTGSTSGGTVVALIDCMK